MGEKEYDSTNNIIIDAIKPTPIKIVCDKNGFVHCDDSSIIIRASEINTTMETTLSNPLEKAQKILECINRHKELIDLYKDETLSQLVDELKESIDKILEE